jgi:hypothetical protein
MPKKYPAGKQENRKAGKDRKGNQARRVGNSSLCCLVFSVLLF